ncbi:MAG: septum formation protein Maf [Flavobacteriales bacterium]|nr:septum formation protein Maf [Flavobacteriales bacterium]
MLREHLADKRIILGSQSPRRQQLLKGLDLDFEIQSKETDESWPSHLSEGGIPEHIALMKSIAFGDLDDNTILITADTIVWMEGKTINKPHDDMEAYLMVKNLSGKTHYVYTGVCIRTATSNFLFHDETAVEFSDLSDEMVSYYVKNYNPLDKAGGYGAQDWIGYVGIESLSGCYYNVMGLPVRKVYRVLSSL